MESLRSGLYALLGLPANPPPEPAKIRKAYHEAALRLHPDKNPDDPQATSRFQNLGAIYDAVMSSSVTVEEYEEIPQRRRAAPNVAPHTDILNAGIYTSEENNYVEISEEDILNGDLPPTGFERREWKKVADQARKLQNSKLQSAARRERNMALEEMARVKKEMNTDAKRMKGGKSGDSDRQRFVVARDVQRMESLVLKLGLKKTKASKPELDDNGELAYSAAPLYTYSEEHLKLCSDSACFCRKAALLESDIRTVLERDRQAEKRDEEFMDPKIPIEYIDPEDTSEIKRVTKNRSKSFLAGEAQGEKKTKDTRHKLREFWTA